MNRAGEPMVDLHVLLVEDDEDTRVPEAELLVALGCQVDIACDGETAVRQALELQPEVVLMDLTVPVIDGFEATRQIRRRARSGYHPHIIAMSGYGDDRSRHLAFEAGCDEYIVKPAVDLGTSLRRYSARHRDRAMHG